MAKRIEYTVEQDIPHIGGLRLTGGFPTVKQDKSVVQFTERYKGQTICLFYATRPALAVLVEEYRAEQAREKAEREERELAQAAKDAEINAPRAAAFEAEVAALIAQIPAGGVRVDVGKIWADGYYPTYSALGIDLVNSDVQVVGHASWLRAMGQVGHEHSETVAYITGERLAEIQAEKAAKTAASAACKEAKAADRTAKIEQAKATGRRVLLADDTELVDGREGFYEAGTETYALPDGTIVTERVRRFVG